MTNISTRTAAPAGLVKFVEFLNSPVRNYVDLSGNPWTVAQTEQATEDLIASGRIVEIPGNPATYEIA